jgi:nitrogen fixation NifU-like protein
VEEIHADFERFHELVTSRPGSEPRTEGLGKLAVFAGVRDYPMRVKCATLAWHALRSALEGHGETAKTE